MSYIVNRIVIIIFAIIGCVMIISLKFEEGLLCFIFCQLIELEIKLRDKWIS